MISQKNILHSIRPFHRSCIRVNIEFIHKLRSSFIDLFETWLAYLLNSIIRSISNNRIIINVV